MLIRAKNQAQVFKAQMGDQLVQIWKNHTFSRTIKMQIAMLSQSLWAYLTGSNDD